LVVVRGVEAGADVTEVLGLAPVSEEGLIEPAADPGDDSASEVPMETLADTLAADTEAVTDTAVLLLESAELAAELQLDPAEPSVELQLDPAEVTAAVGF